MSMIKLTKIVTVRKQQNEKLNKKIGYGKYSSCEQPKTRRGVTMTETYSNAHREGIGEAIKRIQSFKNRTVLQMRIGNSISNEEYEFVCKLIDAQIKLLGMKGSEN